MQKEVVKMKQFKTKAMSCYELMISLAMLSVIMLSTVFIFSCSKKNEQEIKIGAVLPLSGSAGKYGESAKKGIELAVKKINLDKGIKIRVIYEDTQGLPQQGVAAIKKLIAVDNVQVVIGAMASSVTLAIAPVVEKNQIVLISPASSNPDITNAGDYVFRNCVSDSYEGASIAQVAARDLRLHRVAILYINNDYGEGLKKVFIKEFKQLGGDIIAIEKFEPDATDYRSQLAKIKNASPEGIFLVGYKEMILILRQLAELKMKYQILSTVMFDDPEIIEKTGGAAEGVVFSTWRLDKFRKETQEFLKAFHTEYGTEPGTFAAESYDALTIVNSVIRKGAYSAVKIKDALYRIKDFPGVSGDISFDANGDVEKSLVIGIVKDSKFEEFKPSQIKR